eukprot:11220948-Ditylum_brightwellii.AAC.1
MKEMYGNMFIFITRMLKRKERRTSPPLTFTSNDIKRNNKVNEGGKEDERNEDNGTNQDNRAMLNGPSTKVPSLQNTALVLQMNKKGEGGAYLVGLSQFNLENLKDEISEEDVQTHLKMTRICFHCSKGVVADICSIIRECEYYRIKSKYMEELSMSKRNCHRGS